MTGRESLIDARSLLHLPDGLPDGWEIVVTADSPDWTLRRRGITCRPGCACGDPTVCGTVDPDLLSPCPKCGSLVEDLDGFGVLIHDECGYCSHPDSYDGRCRHCGTPDGEEAVWSHNHHCPGAVIEVVPGEEAGECNKCHRTVVFARPVYSGRVRLFVSGCQSAGP